MKMPPAILFPLFLFLIVVGVRAEEWIDRDHELHPGDLIEVKVFQEDDLNATLRVAQDGTVLFPWIGPVPVAHGTTRQAAETIRARLSKRYLVNPQVSVTVKEYGKRRFTVLGQVQKPGAYELPDRATIDLLEAIGMAGGYTRIAAPGRVTLKRMQNGRETVLRVNAGRMASDGNVPALEVLPGDVITVGESIF
jgi:polysaccharide export outer membrane protein